MKSLPRKDENYVIFTTWLSADRGSRCNPQISQMDADFQKSDLRKSAESVDKPLGRRRAEPVMAFARLGRPPGKEKAHSQGVRFLAKHRDTKRKILVWDLVSSPLASEY
jgi:hypothetical protein